MRVAFRAQCPSRSLHRRSLAQLQYRHGCIRRFSVDASSKYAATLNLPKTTFPMRADAFRREPSLLNTNVYSWQKQNNKDGPLHILHDGPPYANGSPHIGHVLNKVLKDITNRYKMMRGYKVEYIPGWDCHGLPIELKALESMQSKDRSNLPALEVRKKAREYALEQIEIQKQEFIKWGVMGDWDHAYRTMDHEYEAAQLGIFAEMVKRGYIYRDLKPVYWSPSSRTALAEAELEYNDDHTTESASELKKFNRLSAVIWTTTPWTLPANRAVCVSSTIDYCVLESKDEHLIVAKERVPEFLKKIQQQLPIVHTFKGSILVGSVCSHPFDDTISSVVLSGRHVTVESGTGLVHTAPGHGHDDFVVCRENNIQAFCPVDDHGRYTSDVCEQLRGKSVLDEANPIVIYMLKEKNLLILKENYKHRYPYDWRTKKPVIIRATRQWFCDLTTIKQNALKALEDVTIIPQSGRTRLVSMLQLRDDWCISRQRHWGVPIPVFYDVETDQELMTDETIQHIQSLFRQHGSDCWWQFDTETLLHPKYRNNGKKYRKGTDTMDVWFDSGVSWGGVLKERGLPLPADLYVEGSDQHRGWFQSSLLTSVAVTGKAPYKTILSHGFVVDEHFRKMSKSLGNVIAPSYIIAGGKDKNKAPAYGVDVMRMWVASTDYTDDASISDSVLALISGAMKKIRNTARFMLGNLYDFTVEKDIVPYNQLREVDRFMLYRLCKFSDEVTQHYDNYAYHRAYKLFNTFSNVDLSAFYFSVIKDRLYACHPVSHERRSAQTVLYHILKSFTKAIAPIAVHTSEDIFQHTPLVAWPRAPNNTIGSVFCEAWIDLPAEWRDESLANRWKVLMDVRDQVNYFIELWRNNQQVYVDKAIGSSLETDVWIYAPEGSVLRSLPADQLAELFIVSNVYVHPFEDHEKFAEQGNIVGKPTLYVGENGDDKFAVGVARAKQHKCPRCWKYISVSEDSLCTPCDKVVASL